MKTRFVAVLLLGAAAAAGVACSGSNPQPSAPPSATPGHPIGSLEMAGRPAFSCTLPVATLNGDLARVALPDGGVTLDQPAPTGPQATASFGHAYRQGRWLPVPNAWLAPAGRSYAYPTVTSGKPGEDPVTTVMLHDIASGRDRQLWSGPGIGTVAGWGPGGVAFTVAPAPRLHNGGDGRLDFWVVDPSRSGAAHRIGTNPGPAPGLFDAHSVMAGGAAWTAAPGATPAPAGVKPAHNQVLRMDLGDGTVETWLTAPVDAQIAVVGADADGHPVLSVLRASRPELLLLTGPNRTTTIGADPALRPFSAFGDRHGVWITAPGSLWLADAAALHRLAGVPDALFPTGKPAALPILEVAGPCA